MSFILLLSVCAGAAQAAPETIAEFGQGAGQVDFPLGTAVDEASGDVYVADRNNNRIDKFDSDGHFLLAWGFGVRDGKSPELQTCGPQATPPQKWCFKNFFGSNSGAGNVNPIAVGVDQESHAVYVVDVSKRRVTKFTESGQFVFLVGRNVNATKFALGGGATQAEKNICTAASGDTCKNGESGTGADEFTSPRSLAVSSTGTVWVGDTSRLKSFDENGAAGAEIPGGGIAGAGSTLALALDSAGNFYVKSATFAGIRELEAGTGALLKTFDLAGQARTVALDADSNVYVGDSTSPYRFLKFNPAGEQVAQFGAGEVIGSPGETTTNGANAIAVGDNAGRLYVASSSPSALSAVQAFPLPEPGPLVMRQGIEDLGPTGVTLTARLDPEGDQTTYHFEYGTSEGYGSSTPTQTLTAEEFESEDVATGLSELTPNTTYHFRVVATNHCNPAEPAEECTAQGEDQTFTTLPAIAIDPQWVTNVTAHTAELHSEMDPLGVEAEAWLEYGTSEGYGHIVSLANLGTGFGVVERQALLTGLQASTTYHFRFAARDERDGIPYTVHGADRSFTTQFGGLGFQLGDNRVWEMVSPPDKHGARLVGGGEIHLQASADGESLAYQSALSTEVDPEGNRILEPSMNLARREAGGVWHSKDITPPNETATQFAIGNGTEYKFFNSDLSEALVEPRSGTPLSLEASERTPYLRVNSEPAVYTPLVTGKEPFSNVPPGTEFGGGEKQVGDVGIVGVSPDFQHVALRSQVPLVEGAPDQALYEWSGGQIKPVSVLPAGEGGTIAEAPYVGSGPGSVRGAVSEDGSRVFWSTNFAGAINALYVRDTNAGESARLDIVQAGASGIGTARPVFQGASANGTTVFFTDSQQLTEDAGSKGSDLYRCELPLGSVISGCATLTDISVPTDAGESAEVQGIATATGSDGSAVYFVAKGVLDENPNEFGDSAVSGQPNFYLWQQGEGVRFLATLSGEDRTDWGELPALPGEGQAEALSAAASPSGRYLAFMSQRSLTGYDNRDETSGEAALEVYRYDAVADQLTCVSCNPTEARPRAPILPMNPPQTLFNPGGLWGGQRVAAALPEVTSIYLRGISLYRPRAVLDNGRVFFNATDSLVPADSNGQSDAYQFEPTGTGDCHDSSGGASVSRAAGGCISLLSSGTAEEEAAFFDADVTGDNAFFFTPAQLSPLDEDQEVDIYDARVEGVAATLPATAECLGESCQPTAAAPNDPTPASAAFKGPGNLKPKAGKRCAKGKHLIRRKDKAHCVARKRGHRKHRRAHTDRGAHR